MINNQKNQPNLRAAWREFLGRHSWNHAAHLTTRHPRSRAALDIELRDRFIRRLARIAQRKVAWFAATELTHIGRPHLHVLLGGTEELDTKQLERCWTAGYSRMHRLVGAKAAVSYAVKECGHLPDNFELSRIWIPKAR